MIVKQFPQFHFFLFMGFKHIQVPKFYVDSFWNQQIYVENSIGDIYQNVQSDAQFQTEWLTSWILIPLLNTMRQTLGKEALIESFMLNFDYEYDALFSPQSNTRYQLNPYFSCALANSKLGITEFNSTYSQVDQFYAYYPLIQQYMEDSIDMVDHVHQKMEKDVGPVRIRSEFFEPFNQAMITGPSVQFERSALGMTSLFTLSLPVSAFFQFTKYFPYEICYDMLDTRYLNVTTQCFLEYDSKAETIQEISAENLRKYSNILSGMGLIFGIVSGWIVLLFLTRVLRVYRVTKLDDIEFSSALKIRIQGPSMISNVETLLMAICTLPLLFDHHIPDNDTFVNSSSGKYKFSQEIIVLLSLSWFIRLGVCMGNMLIHLESRSTYFDMIQGFYSQIVLVAIYLIRLTITVGHADYTGGLVKCGVSIGLCLLFGLIMSLLSKLFDQRTTDTSDPIDSMLGAAHLSRSKNCVIGKEGKRWILSEMLMDNWTIENIKSQFRLLRQASTCVIQIQQEKPYSNKATIIELMRLLSTNEHEFARKKSWVVPDKLPKGPAATNIRASDRTGSDRTRSQLVTTQRQSNHRFGSETMIAKFLVLAQALWLVAVPIKNVVIIPWPQTYPDGISTTQTEYQGYPGFQENDYMTGKEIIDVLEKIINITFENEDIFRKFSETRRFTMDSIVNFVSVEDHVYVSKYLQLLHQTDFNPGRMISFKEDFVLHKSDLGIDINITAICTPEDALLNGMVCTNRYGKPCNDWLDTPVNVNFTFVNLSSYQTNTALKNTFAIYQVVIYFQQSMEQLFKTLDWTMVKDWYFTDCYSYPIISAPENDTMVFEDRFDFLFLYQNNWDRNYTLYNCGLTEQLLVLIYIPNYIINMIQQGMSSHGLSFQPENSASIHWFDTTQELKKMAHVDERMTDLIFNERLYFTSNAKHISYSRVTTSLQNTVLTDTRTSFYANKFFRKYGAEMAIGNPQLLLKNYARRNLHEIVSFFNDDQERNISTKKLYLGGTWWSFIEYVPNRGIHAAKLRETTIAENVSFLPRLIQEEAKYVNWFRNFEETEDRAITRIIMKHLDSSTSNHVCHMHLLRKMTQVLWLMGLSQMIKNHIAYMGIVDVREYTWTLSRMQENVIIGENSMGARFTLPLDGVGNSHVSDGSSAWPYAPMLHKFLKFLQDDALTLRLYMRQMNISFLSLVNIQDGKIDLGGTFCDIGIKKYNITKTDSGPLIYEKLYPAFVKIINETFLSIGTYHRKMERDVGPVGIRHDYFEQFPDMFDLTAMGFGIRKLMSHLEPGDSDIQKLVKAERCYVMLEGRYLNQTIRCFSDYPSFMEIRKAKNSEGLRVFLGSNYALGVVLNVLSSYVAIQFVFQLLHVYRITGFNDLSILLSLDIQAQGPNMMSFSKAFLMATSALPLLLGYHLPPNEEYIDATQNYSPIIVAFILALSLTWYLQIGVMIGSHLIHLKYYNLWYDAVQSRLRYAVLLVIVIIRYYIRIDDGDYTGGVFILVCSCIVAMGLGIVLAIIAKCFDKKPEFEDPLDSMFIDSKTSRTKIGVLGRTDEGWHLSGLLLEGWKIVKHEGKRVSLMQDCKHMIEVEGDEIVKGSLL